jgi:hypothetical protein
MWRGLQARPTRGNRRSGMNEAELRRKLRAFPVSGLFFRLLTAF